MTYLVTVTLTIVPSLYLISDYIYKPYIQCLPELPAYSQLEYISSFFTFSFQIRRNCHTIFSSPITADVSAVASKNEALNDIRANSLDLLLLAGGTPPLPP